MGGASGHIMHLYEDRDMTFRRLKDIITRVGHAKMNEAYEKCDGINLLVTWDFNSDQLRVARNKGNIKEGGLDRHGLSLKFANRPQLLAAFEGAYDALSEAFGKLPHEAKAGIFGATGGVWFSTEVIDPGAYNTIRYDDRNIVFHRHGPKLFDFDGDPLATNLQRNLEVLKANGAALNEALDTNNDWRIHTPAAITLRPVDESVIVHAVRSIDGIMRHGKVAAHDSIRTYLFRRLADDFQRYPLINSTIREMVVRNLVEMPGAPTMTKITSGLDRTLKEQINQMALSGKGTITKLMKPIEEVVHKFGSHVMSGMHSSFIEDGQAEVERLREHLRKCIDDIRNSDDKNGQQILERNLWKLGSHEAINSSMEGIVFQDANRVYKLTGAFAPANQICAYLKYKDRDLKNNRQSLASFIAIG